MNFLVLVDSALAITFLIIVGIGLERERLTVLMGAVGFFFLIFALIRAVIVMTHLMGIVP